MIVSILPICTSKSIFEICIVLDTNIVSKNVDGFNLNRFLDMNVQKCMVSIPTTSI